MTRFKKHSALVLILFFTLTPTAHAYLDAGTGSYIFQIIIASLAGGIFYLKTYYKQIKFYLKNIFKKKK